MPGHYLVAIHRPDNYDPSVEDESMGRDIDTLNDEMVAADIRVFVGGLQSPSLAKSIRLVNGKLETTDGHYLKVGEHVGGLWVLKCADMEEAIEWGRKAAVACRASVEVRPFH